MPLLSLCVGSNKESNTRKKRVQGGRCLSHAGHPLPDSGHAWMGQRNFTDRWLLHLTQGPRPTSPLKPELWTESLLKATFPKYDDKGSTFSSVTCDIPQHVCCPGDLRTVARDLRAGTRDGRTKQV